jgi:hypothetical protein
MVIGGLNFLTKSKFAILSSGWQREITHFFFHYPYIKRKHKTKFAFIGAWYPMAHRDEGIRNNSCRIIYPAFPFTFYKERSAIHQNREQGLRERM